MAKFFQMFFHVQKLILYDFVVGPPHSCRNVEHRTDTEEYQWQNNRCDIEYVKHHKKGAWGGGGLQSCLNRAPCMWFVYWCIAGAPLSLMGACRLWSIGLWHVTATSLFFKFKPYFREIMFWHDFGTIKDCIFSFHSILSFSPDV